MWPARNSAMIGRRNGIARTAFTLIELLVALALTAGIVAVTGRLAVTTLRNDRWVRRQADEHARNRLIAHQLAIDLQNMVDDLPEQAVPLQLYGVPRQTLTLTTVAASLENSAFTHLQHLPCRVRYVTRRDPSRLESYVLLREVTDLTDSSASPRMEMLAQGIRSIQYNVLAEMEWAGEFPGPSKAPARLVQMTIEWADGGERLERILPVGVAQIRKTHED